MKKEFKSRKTKIVGGVASILLICCLVFILADYLSTHTEDVYVRSGGNQYGNGYEMHETTGKAKTNLSSQKISLVVEDGYSETEPTTNAELAKWRDEQIERILQENNLTAYDLTNYGDKIEASIMSQIQSILEQYEQAAVDPVLVKGKDGADGKDGKDGIQGATGARGPQGPQGATGKTGQTGQQGAQGVQGIQGVQGVQGEKGETGESGKSTFIAYAEDAYGTGFSKAPTETTKYIGTCITTRSTAPDDPTMYSWQQYKEYIITYDDVSNTLIIR